MARYNDNTAVQLQALKDQREREENRRIEAERAYDNATLHGRAGRKWLGGAPAMEPSGPSTSVFAANLDTGFNSNDDALRAGFDGILANANAMKADRARRGRTVLGSMVGKAMNNGGMVPQELGAAYGKELGMNGPAFGTLAKDGTFISLGMGQNGRIQPTGMVDPFGVLGAMVQSGNWKDAGQFEQKYLRGKYTPQQIAQTGYTDKWYTQMRNKSISDASAAEKMKFLGEAQKVLAELGKGGKQTSFEDFIRAIPKEVISGMARGDMEVDANGNPVMDAEEKPLYKQATPAEIGQRLREVYDSARAGAAAMPQDDDGGELRNAILGAVRRMFAPPVDPRDAAMYDQAKQQEYIRSRPQSAFSITGADGRERHFNGWLFDGRFYDGRGNDITDTIADGENIEDLTTGETYHFSSPASAAQPAQSGNDELAALEAEKARRAAAPESAEPQPAPAQAAAPQTATVPAPAPESAETAPAADSAAPAPAPAAASTASPVAQPSAPAPKPVRSPEQVAYRERLETPLRDQPLSDIPGSALIKMGQAVSDAEVRAAEKVGKELVKIPGRARDYIMNQPLVQAGKTAVQMLNLSPAQIMERKRQFRDDERGRRMDEAGKLENERRQREGDLEAERRQRESEAAERKRAEDERTLADQERALYRLRKFSASVGVEDPADFIRDPDGMMALYGDDMDDDVRAAIRTLEVAPDSIWGRAEKPAQTESRQSESRQMEQKRETPKEQRRPNQGVGAALKRSLGDLKRGISGAGRNVQTVPDELRYGGRKPTKKK